MKKFFKFIMRKVSCSILFVTALSMFLSSGCSKNSAVNKIGSNDSLKIVSVDEVYSNPGKYKQLVKMSGKIVSIEKESSTLSFGCEDACIRVPVHYNGELPVPGSSAAAIGKVIKKDGKFMFEAQKIETK